MKSVSKKCGCYAIRDCLFAIFCCCRSRKKDNYKHFDPDELKKSSVNNKGIDKPVKREDSKSNESADDK